MNTKHRSVVLLLIILTLIIYLIVYIVILYPCYHTVFYFRHYWSFYCYLFILIWWLIYFMSGKLKLWSLRLFLNKMSKFRTENNEEMNRNNLLDLEKAIILKSSSSIYINAIYIAIVALFVALVMQYNPRCEFQRLVRIIFLVTAIISIIFMTIAVDLLDTIANRFRVGDKKPYEYQVYFYSKMGPPGVKGGISYAYWGYAWFSLFLILSVSFFYPLLAGLGLSVFTYLGYPVMFGYKGEWNNSGVYKVEIDEELRWPPIILSGAFLFITVLIFIIGEKYGF